MDKLLNHPQAKPLLSDEHFSVDGTLIEARASQKSFCPKDGSGDADDGADFRGQKRKNDTHASTTDPDSRLYRKAAGREAKPCLDGCQSDADFFYSATIGSSPNGRLMMASASRAEKTRLRAWPVCSTRILASTSCPTA